jgi:gliding motility-associated-like protein
LNKPFYIIIFLLLFCCEAKAQTNLVYNGDFEIYSGCPQNFSGPFSIPYEIENCTGWTAPTYSTSDYFNICNNSLNGLVGVPTNGLGVQNAFSGNGYCGFLAYSFSNGGCYTGSYWWEYIQGHFTQPLIAGHTYSVGFRFSLAEGSDLAVKQLGFYISNTAVSNTCSPSPLAYIPQITSSGTAFLTDTANWFLISGEYTALGGEQYITIGNFKDSLATDTSNMYYPGLNVNLSYYYIDAGNTYDITDFRSCNGEPIIPNVFTPNADGVNDVMRISDTCFKVNSLSVYNRWGNLLLDSKTNDSWDGRTTSGEPCNDGIYYYIIETENKKGEAKIQKGFIQLIR